MRPLNSVLAIVATAVIATPAFAQQPDTNAATAPRYAAVGTDSTTKDSSAAAAAASKKAMLLPPIEIQHMRPNDQRGINVFEAPKETNVPFTGFKLGFGAGFTQQFQALAHSNTATPVIKPTADGKSYYNSNALINIGHGFNNAVANAYLNAQLARGIRVAMTGYLSARHHNETWIKDGYLLIDDSPIDFMPLNVIMAFTTVKAGHFEINYGDTHFRRTDNGNAMFNPLVGNYIMDAFTTQVGGEVMLRAKGAFVMGGVTNGEVRGTIQNPTKRAPAFLAKVGADEQLTPAVRTRLTASMYSQSRSANQTLYSGDRAGSRYYDMLESSTSSETSNAWSGAIQPFSGPNAGLHAAVINPFVKVGPVEYFGNFERAKGRSASDPAQRTVNQISNELTYRFLGDQLYVTGRYNTVSGKLSGIADDITVKRSQFGAGWFITPVVLMKGEYVNQKYLDFPSTDIRNGGKFNGFVAEATIAF
jgi:hypothetical protein